jgi:AcrR family transcriptional regulator
MSTTLSSRGAARREAVLEVARDLLVREGFDQFVLRRVADRANMTLGNLQYYFATRDDLLEAVIRAEFDRDVAALRAAADLDGIVHTLAGNWTTGAGSIFTTLWMLGYHHERFRRLNQEIYQTFYAELGAVIRAVSPETPDADLAIRSRLITAVLDGIATQAHAVLGTGTPGHIALLNRATTLVQDLANGRY